MSSTIRVVILFQHAEHWINVKALYAKMCVDSRFSVTVWLVPTVKDADQFKRVSDGSRQTSEINLLSSQNIPYLTGDEIVFNQFDAAFFLTPYDQTRPTAFSSLELKKRINHLLYIPYALEIGDGPTSQINQHATAVHQLCSGVFVRSKYSLKSFQQHSPRGSDHVYLTGLPLHDELFKISEFKADPSLVSEIGNRFPILWNSHYSFDGNIWSTFDAMVKELFIFAKNNPDIALIWRPHPWIFNVFHKYGILDEYSEPIFIKTLADWGIIYDRRADVRHVLSVAKAVMTDASSLLLMVLPLDVPVLYLSNPRGRGLLEEGKHLTKAYDIAETPQQAIEFIRTVVKGEDKKRLLRKAILNNHVEQFNGMASDRIIEIVYQIVTRGSYE